VYVYPTMPQPHHQSTSMEGGEPLVSKSGIAEDELCLVELVDVCRSVSYKYQVSPCAVQQIPPHLKEIKQCLVAPSSFVQSWQLG
jgi:hypothetical protein